MWRKRRWEAYRKATAYMCRVLILMNELLFWQKETDTVEWSFVFNTVRFCSL